MLKPMLVFAMLSAASTLQQCPMQKLSETDKETLCLALSTADPLQYLDANDRRLVREKFSRSGKDGLKMALASMRKIKCD